MGSLSLYGCRHELGKGMRDNEQDTEYGDDRKVEPCIICHHILLEVFGVQRVATCNSLYSVLGLQRSD